MTKVTHVAGGMLISIIGFITLKYNNLLLPDVNEFIQWLIIYPFCLWGSTAPDLDHNKKSIPSKDYASRFINMLLHIGKPLSDFAEKNLGKSSTLYKIGNTFNAKHRSIQTHSDLTLWIFVYILHLALNGKIRGLNAIDTILMTLVVTGICMGVTAHLILDMLTPDGIYLIVIVVLNKLLHTNILRGGKIHFVPHIHFFATGGEWERWVNKILRVLTYLALLIVILILISPYAPVTINFS